MGLIILLIGLAAVLLLAETLLPGGVLGTLGVLCLGGAVAVTYSRYGSPTGHYMLAGLVLAFSLAGVLWMSFFPQSRLGRNMWFKAAPVTRADEPRRNLVGKIGVAETPLRPSGTARILGERHDVITQGDYIEQGARIEVARVTGNRIEVRAHRTALADEETVVG